MARKVQYCGDLTRLLELGYFSAYNVPFFREVYDRSGYAKFATDAAAKGRDYEEAVEGDGPRRSACCTQGPPGAAHVWG